MKVIPVVTHPIGYRAPCDVCHHAAIVELIKHPELDPSDYDYESILLCEEHARKMVKDVEAIYK